MHNRKKRLSAKRQDVIASATAIIEAIAERKIDAYEGWQQVSGIFQKNAGLGLPELRDFIHLEGAQANDSLSVTEQLRDTIRQNAVRFLSVR